MSKPKIISSIPIIGAILIIIALFTRNVFGSYLMISGIILINIHFVYRLITLKPPVGPVSIGNEKLNLIIFYANRILRLALFVVFGVILCYYYFIKMHQG
jgi:hypothetical protein